MLMRNRFIFSDNAVLKDISRNLNDFLSGSEVLPIVAAEDFIFVGSELPFNHRWIEVKTPNAVASKVKIALWDGNEFVDAVDIFDQTAVGGATLAQSGYISWVLDKDESWAQEDTLDANDNVNVIGLKDVKIFDLYWSKWSFDTDLTAGTELSFVGHKFADEFDLEIIYPILNTANAKTQFKAGKTDWKDQEFLAAEEVIRYLKARGVILNKDQILNWEIFKNASVHKVAEIIYRAYGNDFNDDKKLALGEFMKSMNQEIFQVDRNRDARINDNERFRTTGNLFR